MHCQGGGEAGPGRDGAHSERQDESSAAPDLSHQVVALPQKLRQVPGTAIDIFSRPTVAAWPDTAFLVADAEALRRFAIRSTAAYCRAELP